MTIGGIEITLGGVVDLIILIGAACAAIYKIWEFIAKPTATLKSKKAAKDKERTKLILDEVLPSKINERLDEVLSEKLEEKLEDMLDDMLPGKLIDHDLQVRDKYKADRANYLTLIRDDVLKQVKDPIQENKDDLEALKISAKDVLREKIMRIYHTYKHERAFPLYEQEALEQYYKDYKRLDGNSYIDKYYGRMKKWDVIYDDYHDDEE